MALIESIKRNRAMTQYLYRIMVTRPKMLLEGSTEEEQPITTAHFHYLKDLEAQRQHYVCVRNSKVR